LKKAAEDQANQQKASLDLAEVVDQYDTLAKKIVADLTRVESDLDTLRGIEDLVSDQGKQSSQYFYSFLTMRVLGNIPTTKMHVSDAKNSIRTKG